MREILFLILITFNTVASGTNYYISNKGSDASNGQSPTTAWKTLKNVNTQKFNPGDSILFERGGVWNESLEITSSGSPAGQITYNAYGTGYKPVFNGISEVSGWTNSGNWTNMGSNVWRINISHPGIYGRVWLNDTERERSLSATEGVGITADRPWQLINKRLYIYSTSNPAGSLSSIKITSPGTSFLNATDKNYITLHGIEISGWFHIIMRGCSHWIIEHCDILKSGLRGFDIERNGNTFTTNIIIRHCNFDTGLTFYNARIVDGNTHVYFYTEYAIRMNGGGVYDWDIHDNTFKGWAYTVIWFSNHKQDGYRTEGVRIFRNFTDGMGMNYGRAVAGHQYTTQVSANNPIEIFDNTFFNHGAPCQLGIAYAKVYNNIFNGVVNRLGARSESSNALTPMSYSGRGPYEMKVFNNVFANCGYAGSFWALSSGGGEFRNVRFVNNIFYENGYAADWQQLRISYWPTSAALINPQIDNNLFYASARTDVLYVLGTRMTVPQFNALDGNNDQNLNPSGNIYADPLFVDPENGDFSLQPGSPAIGAGLTPLSGKDRDGTEWGDKPGIGPFAIDKSKGPVKYYTLSLENKGNGIVLSNGKEENSVTVESDTTMTIEAIPDSGWIFSNWAGDVSGYVNPLDIKMNEDKNIKAIFTEDTYTLTIICEGEGEVRIFPAQESYVSGTMINLEALAEELWEFHKWEGDLISADIQTSFLIEQNMKINARFKSLSANSNLISERQKNIHIYPNPAKGFFSISAEESTVKPDGFNIIDLSGRTVYQGILISNISNIQIPNFLNSGIYIIELISKKIPFYTQRLVITK